MAETVQGLQSLSCLLSSSLGKKFVGSCPLVFHYMNTLQFRYPFYCWQTFGLFPGLGNFEQCCEEHSHAVLRVHISTDARELYTLSGDATSQSLQAVLSLADNHPRACESGRTTVHSQQPCMEATFTPYLSNTWYCQYF